MEKNTVSPKEVTCGSHQKRYGGNVTNAAMNGKLLHIIEQATTEQVALNVHAPIEVKSQK